jgi:hypothetical protein
MCNQLKNKLMMPKASNVYSQDYRIEFSATPSGSYVVRAF